MLNGAAPTSPTPVQLRDRLGISQVRRAYTGSNVRRRTGCIRIRSRQCSCGGAVDEPSFDAFSTTFAAGGGSEVATPYSTSAPPVSSRAESRYSVWRTLSTSDVASASLWLSGWVSAAHAHAILQGRASAARPPTSDRRPVPLYREHSCAPEPERLCEPRGSKLRLQQSRFALPGLRTASDGYAIHIAPAPR